MVQVAVWPRLSGRESVLLFRTEAPQDFRIIGIIGVSLHEPGFQSRWTFYQTNFLLLLDGPASTVQMPTSPRSPLSGIPVRTAPAAAVSPIQVL